MAGSSLTQGELLQAIGGHKGLAGTSNKARKIVDPQIPTLTKDDPNPDITYKLGDGTHFSVHFNTATGLWDVTDPGTALVNKPTSATRAQTFTDPQTGQVYQLDPSTNTWSPATGLPASGETPAAQNADTATQRAAAAATIGQQNADTAAGRAVTSQQNADTAAGRAFAQTASASDQFILSIDPTTGQMTQQPNPNYDPTIRSDQRDQLTRQAAQDQLAATQRDLQNQIALGQLSDSEARQAFQDQYDMLTAGLNAGQEAVKNAQLSTVNAVGPNFGANFAAAVNGVAQGDPSQVHFSPGDFTYKMRDFAAISQKATAAAIAHLSPFAAQISGRAAPVAPTVAPYTPPPAPAAPNVLQAAANSVVSGAGQQQAPPPGPPRIGPYQPGS